MEAWGLCSTAKDSQTHRTLGSSWKLLSKYWLARPCLNKPNAHSEAVASATGIPQMWSRTWKPTLLWEAAWKSWEMEASVSGSSHWCPVRLRCKRKGKEWASMVVYTKSRYLTTMPGWCGGRSWHDAKEVFLGGLPMTSWSDAPRKKNLDQGNREGGAGTTSSEAVPRGGRRGALQC